MNIAFCSAIKQKISSLSLTDNDAVANTIEIISAQTIPICLKVDDFGFSRKN